MRKVGSAWGLANQGLSDDAYVYICYLFNNHPR